MDVVWRSSRDPADVVRVHRRWNPGIFELADQYSHLRADDLTAKGFRAWTRKAERGTDGLILAVAGKTSVFVPEIWAEVSGLADRRVQVISDRDRRLLDQTRRLLESTRRGPKRSLLVRVAADNPFGRLFAHVFGPPLDSTLTLSTRETSLIRAPRLAPCYSIRAIQDGDQGAYASIHNRCFNDNIPEGSMGSWAFGVSHESFTATCRGEPVGFIIAERRRGGRIGDFNLAIDEDHRGHGLGTALLAEGMASFVRREVLLVVADHWAMNAPAVAFYRKHGFSVARSYDFFSFARAIPRELSSSIPESL